MAPLTAVWTSSCQKHKPEQPKRRTALNQFAATGGTACAVSFSRIQAEDNFKEEASIRQEGHKGHSTTQSLSQEPAHQETNVLEDKKSEPPPQLKT